MPASRTEDPSTDVVRWAAFSCVLVPVVLLWYGTSLGGATGTALGLAAVTAVCRVLLRRSERCAARLLEERPHRGRHQRRRTGTGGAGAGKGTGRGAHRTGAGTGTGTGTHRTGSATQRTGAGTHRGGRHSAPPAHSGGNTPVA